MPRHVTTATILAFAALSILAGPPSVLAFSASDVETFKTKPTCSSCDLSGANLSGVAKRAGGDFAHSNFSRADLSGATLINVLMNGADFSHANLSGVKARAAELYGADLTGADLSHASFTDSNLGNAKMGGADTSGTRFCRTEMPDGTMNNSGC